MAELGPPLVRTLLVVGLLALVPSPGARSSLGSPTVTPSSCQVTVPARTVAPSAGSPASGFNYGNQRLRTHLFWLRGRLVAGTFPDGGSFATVNPDGSIFLKLGWWRGVRGRLVIGGRRLDGPARRLRASVREGYGLRGFQPSGITFPTVGCWRVSGRVARTRLVFVVQVTTVRARAGGSSKVTQL